MRDGRGNPPKASRPTDGLQAAALLTGEWKRRCRPALRAVPSDSLGQEKGVYGAW